MSQMDDNTLELKFVITGTGEEFEKLSVYASRVNEKMLESFQNGAAKINLAITSISDHFNEEVNKFSEWQTRIDSFYKEWNKSILAEEREQVESLNKQSEAVNKYLDKREREELESIKRRNIEADRLHKEEITRWQEAENERLWYFKKQQDEALAVLSRSHESQTLLRQRLQNPLPFQTAPNLYAAPIGPTSSPSIWNRSIGFGQGTSDGGFKTGFSNQVASFAMLAALFKGGEILSGAVESSQKIQDLQMNLKGLLGTTEKASSVFKFFSDAQKDTRANTLQLVEAFNQMLPVLRGRGFDDNTSQSVVLQLSRLAAQRARVMDKPFDTTFEEMQQGFLNAVAGRVSGATNPFLQSIGVSRFDVNSGKTGIQDMISKMDEVAAKYKNVGDDIQSVNSKIKTSFQQAFGEGYNKNRDEMFKSLRILIDELTKPDLLNAIKNIGISISNVITFIAKMGSPIIGVFEIIAGSVLKFEGVLAKVGGVIVSTFVNIVEAPLTAFKKVFDFIGDITGKLAANPILKQAEGLGALPKGTNDFFNNFASTSAKIGGVVNPLIEKLELVKNGYKDVADAFRTMGNSAIDAGMDRLFDAFHRKDDGYSDITTPKNSTVFPNLTNDKLAGPRDTAQKLLDTWKNQIEITKAAKQEATSLAETFKGNLGKAIGAFGVDLAQINKTFDLNNGQVDEFAKKLGDTTPIVLTLRNALDALKHVSEDLAETKLWASWLGAAKASGIEQLKGLEKSAVGEDIWGRRSVDSRIKEGIKEEKDDAKAFTKYLNESIREDRVFEKAAGVFISVLVDGPSAKNFGKSMAKEFQNGIATGATSLFHDFLNLVSGIKENPDGTFTGKSGKIYNKLSDLYGDKDLNSTTRRNAQAGLQFGEIGIGSYFNARANYQGAQTQGLIGGALSGASLGIGAGGWIGAVVGAIAGLLGAAMGKAETRSQYKYGQFGVTSGIAFGNNYQNLREPEIKNMLQEVQSTYDQFWNGFVNIILKFGDKVLLPALTNIDGTFQRAASAHFLEHFFDQWVKETLPDTINNMFKEGLGNVAKNLGMNIGRFTELWNQFDRLDPAKRLELWAGVFDALSNIQKAMDYFLGKGFKHTFDPSNPHDVDDAFGINPNGLSTGGGRGRIAAHPGTPVFGTWGMQFARSESVKTFADGIKESDEQILKLGNSIKSLTGEAQIKAAQDLGNMLVERMNKEKQFYQELIALQQQVTDQVTGLKDNWQAALITDEQGNPDIKGQAKFWRDKADEALTGLRGATKPEDVQKFWNQFLEDIQKAQGLQASLGPMNAKEANKWAIDAINYGFGFFQQKIQELGDSVNNINDEFTNKILPSLNSFTDIITAINNNGDGLPDVFDNIGRHGRDTADIIGNDLNPALGDLAERVNNLITIIDGMGSGSASASSNSIDSYKQRVVNSRY